VAHQALPVRVGVSGILRRAGYAVDMAEDAMEATWIIEATPDLAAIVIAADFPPGGVEAFLEGFDPGPPAVVVAPVYGEAHLRIYENPQIRAVVPRPFPLRVLLDKVELARVPRRRPCPDDNNGRNT